MTRNRLSSLITDAIQDPDPADSNQKVTLAHYQLSEALEQILRPAAGANFHSWAVWGSKKAGVTIRQEDLDSALKNATRVSGLTGLAVGLLAAGVTLELFNNLLPFTLLSAFLLLAGGLLGVFPGALVGRLIARYSRKKAARLILEGNHTVLEEIGGKTAEFVTLFENGQTDESLNDFFDSFRSGATEQGGQDLLKRAFKAYLESSRANTTSEKQQACYYANCLAIVHEHIRLQPYITKSLPWIIRHCVTERMMHYEIGNQEIGEVSLSVAEDLPTFTTEDGLGELSHKELLEFLYGSKGWLKSEDKVAATNWTSIKQRMRYVLVLFQRFHLDARVCSHPYANTEPV